ncbi:MAG TPA: dTMP kinase [Candidatus Bathyarchaeia archaeon]|nr:dTMP kinase [Candidatus Bathyarchaeia archaeon]
MKPNPYPGFFVVIEGLDGCGASSQIEPVAEALRIGNKEVTTTSEPTDNILGGLLRGALTGVYRLPPASLQLLFVADRLHHLDRLIEPVLKKGELVLCDRYFWSTIAYGSIDLDFNWLLEINQYCLLPDLSIFLKVDPLTCFQQIKKSRFGLELFENRQKLDQVWRIYEKLARKYPREIVFVDGERVSSEVKSNILKAIKHHPKFS